MRLLVIVAILFASHGFAAANGWSGFYSARTPEVATPPNASEVPQIPAAGRGACVRAILAAQERHGIPDNILLGIGLQEAGRQTDGRLTVWPWAVNAAGEGRFFGNGAEALSWVRERLGSGVRSIDVGCMQINLRWHPDAFATLEEGFDPVANADYAARFLVDLHRKTGSWSVAAGSYHSFTPEKRNRYLEQLRRNVAVANQRIAELRELAAVDGEAPRQMQVAAAPAATGAGGYWSASLSDASGTGARSIYGQAELQPILPAFQRAP